MTDNLLPFRRATSAEVCDTALLDACSAGDRTALDELFRRHGDQVRRIVARLRYVARQDLDDIVQNAFLQVFRSASRYDERAAVSTWIVGVAMNVVRRYVRSESRRRFGLSALRMSGPPGRQVGPEDAASSQELVGNLQAGFDGLPENLRVVFTLCDLEGMRSVDVARAIGIPEGTVWRRLHQARRKLRAHLQGAGWP